MRKFRNICWSCCCHNVVSARPKGKQHGQHITKRKRPVVRSSATSHPRPPSLPSQQDSCPVSANCNLQQFSAEFYLKAGHINNKSNHLCSASSFLKYEKFPLEITLFETSRMQLPLLSDFDLSFRAKDISKGLN